VLAALDAGLREATGAPPPAPVVCFAGHDAGVVAAQRPAGMVLVRNPTGISHAPEEEVALEDAAAGAEALLAAVRALA
jgi:N-carbamoyl-L-amino-acid hydrolase